MLAIRLTHSLLLFGVLFMVSGLAQTARVPLPIPLGETRPVIPLINLPPFVSIYDPPPTPPVVLELPVALTIIEAARKKAEPAIPLTIPAPPAAVSIAPAPVIAVPAASPPLSPEERKARVTLLTKILTMANEEAHKYNRLFRDLSAEETRLSEQFNEKGEIKQKRKVVLDMVVYQSRLDEQMGYEYRNAKMIEGKAQKVDDKRIEKFFQKLLQADSLGTELNLINAEGFQHDLPLGASFYGLTLHQWREIEAWALADMGFQVVGREVLDGSEVVVLFYQQTRSDKRLEWELPSGFGYARAEQSVRGHLWLDVNTLQIRQGEREMWVTLSNTQAPLRIWRQTMSYRPSSYGIWVPKKFVSDFFFRIERSKDGVLTVSQTGRLTSEYGDFKRFAVSSEEQDKKTLLKEPATPSVKPK